MSWERHARSSKATATSLLAGQIAAIQPVVKEKPVVEKAVIPAVVKENSVQYDPQAPAMGERAWSLEGFRLAPRLPKKPDSWIKMRWNKGPKMSLDEGPTPCSCPAESDCSLGAGICVNALCRLECLVGACPTGNCVNNKLQKPHLWSMPTQLKDAGAKGFGLFSRVDAPADTFVAEYVGEVLSQEEARSRLGDARHFYVISMPDGHFLDASRKGGYSRFINHSCEPNCVTQTWIVNGEYRVAIYTLKPIKAGEELTFDYQMEQIGRKKQQCFCGAPNCRKFLGRTAEEVAIDASKERNRHQAGQTQNRRIMLQGINAYDWNHLTGPGPVDEEAGLCLYSNILLLRNINPNKGGQPRGRKPTGRSLEDILAVLERVREEAAEEARRQEDAANSSSSSSSSSSVSANGASPRATSPRRSPIKSLRNSRAQGRARIKARKEVQGKIQSKGQNDAQSDAQSEAQSEAQQRVSEAAAQQPGSPVKATEPHKQAPKRVLVSPLRSPAKGAAPVAPQVPASVVAPATAASKRRRQR